jgi:aerobic C4-dicarboxylate transport protein
MDMTRVAAQSVAPAAKSRIYEHLYFQVLCGMVLGILLGYFYPQAGGAMKPLGDAFIKLIRMIIAPIIFCTVVHASRWFSGYIASCPRPSFPPI